MFNDVLRGGVRIGVLVGVVSIGLGAHAVFGDAPAGRFSTQGAGIMDSETHLLWHTPILTGVTPSQGALDCATTPGVRVPTAKELLTLVDVRKQTIPKVDTAFELYLQSNLDLWSATEFGGQGLYVDFAAGLLKPDAVTTPHAVLCVELK